MVANSPNQLVVASHAWSGTGNYNAYVAVTDAKGKTASAVGPMPSNVLASDPPPQYTIYASGPSASINPFGAVSVTQGNSQTFTISANQGFYLTDVYVDGTDQGAISSYTFTNVQCNHSIYAVVAQYPNTYELDLAACFDNGGTYQELQGAGVYIDGNYVGNTPTTVFVTAGYHYITFDTTYYCWTFASMSDSNSNYYNAGDWVPIYSNIEVDALYAM